MRTKTSPAGKAGLHPGQSGFTLFEILAVLAIVALVIGAMVLVPGSGSGSSALKSTVQETASRLRETRALAINQGRSKAVLIDTGRRIIASSNGSKPLKIANGIRITMTAAASEQRSRRISGVRFFSNGSSTGGTIQFARDDQAFEIRINWLTGRVSVNALP